jgi:hypothetical protein
MRKRLAPTNTTLAPFMSADSISVGELDALFNPL